jgi:AraC-like DNA-binding protein
MSCPSVISASLANAIVSTISVRGGNIDLLLARLGISAEEEQQDWSLAKFTAVLEAAALEKRDPLFGLALGKSFKLGGLGPIATLMRASSCGAEAFSNYTKYVPAFQTNTNFGFMISGDVARLSYLITDRTITRRRQDAEFSIALQLSILSQLLEAEVLPTRIDFQHRRDDSAKYSEYRAALNCDVAFGRRENAIYLPARYLTKTSPNADTLISTKIEAEIEASISVSAFHIELSSSIEGWMSSAISGGQSIEIDNAASAFGMSLRSFQRKLRENEINYRELRNNILSKIGKCLLNSTSMSVTSIALYLGYSETSSFSRYFKHINGLSPLQFRESAVVDVQY